MSSYTEEQVAYKASLKGVALKARWGSVVLQGKKNKYVIEEVLGSGGYAITYKATAKCDVEVKTGNITTMMHDVEMTFAIKEFVMEGCYRADDGRTLVIPHTISKKCDHAKAAFKKEAETLMELSGRSANIVPVNEYIEANGTCYYVMQYLEGGSLCGLKNLTEDSALDVILPICSLLQTLHTEYHLLHLDVKPDNIMMTSDSRGRSVPVLIDFGVAKHFDKKGRPTSSNFFQGATKGYAPIEQSANAEIDRFDSRIEVYSVGATLYYLLTHKDPPDAVSLMKDQSVLRKELEKHSVSEKTIVAILKAMSPSREDRMGTSNNAIGPFMAMLNGKSSEPKPGPKPKSKPTDPLEPKPKPQPHPKPNPANLKWTRLLKSASNVLRTINHAMINPMWHFLKAWGMRISAVGAVVAVVVLSVLIFKPQQPIGEDSVSCLKMADSLWNVGKDYKGAVVWYARAAELGDAKAQFRLGECYYNGRGVDQDYAKAVEWYAKSAEQGRLWAQNMLGICYENGEGVDRDYTKAVEWYTKAANQGHSTAQYNLGKCYENGLGVSRDYDKAVGLYTKAAGQGDRDARRRLEQLNDAY